MQGADYWQQLLAFGQSIKKLTSLNKASCAPAHFYRKLPTEQQSVAALAIAEKLEEFY